MMLLEGLPFKVVQDMLLNADAGDATTTTPPPPRRHHTHGICVPFLIAPQFSLAWTAYTLELFLSVGSGI